MSEDPSHQNHRLRHDVLAGAGRAGEAQREDISLRLHANGISRSLQDGRTEERDRLQLGDFCIDYLAMEVSYREREVRLSLTQYQILVLLTRRPRVVISLDDLIIAVWDTMYVSRNNIHVHIHFIRKALVEAGASADIIKTVRGVGYRFDPPDQSH